MSVLVHWLGTFFMFVGFIALLCGMLVLRLRPEDLGRMYLSATMMTGGEMSQGLLHRLLLTWRASEQARRRFALKALAAGLLLSLAGAALTAYT